MKRIKATEASRGFADLLDRVEHRGEEFVIERRGRAIAAVVPVQRPAAGASTITELLAALGAAPAADDRFRGDLRRIRRAQGGPRDPWASSSTRRS